jgi:hypothetical protein
MRTIAFVFALLSTAAFAGPIKPTDLPGDIIVHLQDGTTQTFSLDEYEVIYRGAAKAAAKPDREYTKLKAGIEGLKAKVAALEAKLRESEAKARDGAVEAKRLSKALAAAPAPTYNTVTAYAGYGPDGVQAAANSEGTLVKERLAPVIGLGYARNVYDSWALGAEVLHGVSRKSTTYTGTLSLGYGF